MRSVCPPTGKAPPAARPQSPPDREIVPVDVEGDFQVAGVEVRQLRVAEFGGIHAGRHQLAHGIQVGPATQAAGFARSSTGRLLVFIAALPRLHAHRHQRDQRRVVVQDRPGRGSRHDERCGVERLRIGHGAHARRTARVNWISVLPRTSAWLSSNGELPKSKPGARIPSTSPMHRSPRPRSRNASASSGSAVRMILSTPRPKATAAVVNARKTSMTTTVPSSAARALDQAFDANFHNDVPINPPPITSAPPRSCPMPSASFRKSAPSSAP